jgi:hypothetical protein
MMDIFKKFFIMQALVTTLNRLPPLHTFVMDLVYPEPVRRSHPFDKLSYSDLHLPTKNIPLVTRGSASYAMTPDTSKITQIDPANFTPSITLSAADCNRFRSLGLGGQQQLIDNHVDTLRRSVRKSTEALAIQSITGKIAYDIRNGDGAMDTYEVDFGTPKAVIIGKKWDDPAVKVGDVVAGLGMINGDLKKTSDGADIIHLIKYDVYAALANLSAANKDLVKVNEDHILVGTSKFYLCNSQYYSYREKAFKEAVPDKSVVSIARDDAFGLYYCALDSFDADFAALPFGVRMEPLADPEGVKFIGQSRPMPVPNVEAIRTAQVLA